MFKKGDGNTAANCHLIFHTSICKKMLEHAVMSSKGAHFDKHDILNDAQRGFMKKRSCETQLILTVDDLTKELDKWGQTTPPCNLRQSLPTQYSTNTSSWSFTISASGAPPFNAFIRTRLYKSQQGPLTPGVTQSFSIGLTLFFVYIDDLDPTSKPIYDCSQITPSSVIKATSQTPPSTSIGPEQALEELQCWQVPHIYHFEEKQPTIVNYSLHVIALKRVSSAKYLSVGLKKDLNCCQTTCVKASKTSAFMYRRTEAKVQMNFSNNLI